MNFIRCRVSGVNSAHPPFVCFFKVGERVFLLSSATFLLRDQHKIIEPITYIFHSLLQYFR